MYCNLSSSRALSIYGMKYTNVVFCVQVNNAGVMACPQQYTEDGFEYQLGVRLHCHWKSLKIISLFRSCQDSGCPCCFSF